jgi:hypothetical protein
MARTKAENILGPITAAKTVKDKVAEIKKHSDSLSSFAAQIGRVQKTIGRIGSKGKRVIVIKGTADSDDFIIQFSLEPTGELSTEEKLVIFDKISELTKDLINLEMKALYKEIQRLGGEI